MKIPELNPVIFVVGGFGTAIVCSLLPPGWVFYTVVIFMSVCVVLSSFVIPYGSGTSNDSVISMIILFVLLSLVIIPMRKAWERANTQQSVPETKSKTQ